MDTLKKYHNLGNDLINKLKLTEYPVAVKMIKKGETVPESAVRPLDYFGYEVPPCVTYTYCKKTGTSFYVTGDDVACKPISICFGFRKPSDPDDLFRAWEKHAGYKINAEMEKKSREDDVYFAPFEFEGFLVSPLHETLVEPDIVMIYCTPLALSHLTTAATYDGQTILSNFNGMESSCKEGIMRTFKANKCNVVIPGMGDRLLSANQDSEVIFSIPNDQLDYVNENLYRYGSKIADQSPFGFPHHPLFLGDVMWFNQHQEPGVWPDLREKLGEKPEGHFKENIKYKLVKRLAPFLKYF